MIDTAAKHITAPLVRSMLLDADETDRSFQAVQSALDSVDVQRRDDAEAYMLCELRARQERRQYTTLATFLNLQRNLRLAQTVIQPGESFAELRDATNMRADTLIFDRDMEFKHASSRFALMGKYREPHEPLKKSFDRLRDFHDKFYCRRTSEDDIEAMYSLVGDHKAKFGGSYEAVYGSAIQLLSTTWYDAGFPGQQALPFLRASLQECRPEEPLSAACHRVATLFRVGGDMQAATVLRGRLEAFVQSGSCAEGATVDHLVEEMSEYVRTADALASGNRNLGESAFRYVVGANKKPSLSGGTSNQDGWLILGEVRVPVRGGP